MSREKASASPPRIMVFSVSPLAASPMKAASTDSGMDSSTARVARALPKNIRMRPAVSSRPTAPIRTRLPIALLTKID